MSVKLYSNVEVAETGDAPTAHDVLGAQHTVSGGAALDLVGQSAANTLARVTPSTNPGAAAKVLASDAAGLLTLQDLTLANDLRAGGGAYFGKTSTDPTRGEISTSDAVIPTGVRVAKPSGWGTSKDVLRVLILGQTDPAIKETIALGVDPSANAHGGPFGDGREILLRRGARFVTPNSTNDNFFYKQLCLQDGTMGVGTVLGPTADGRTHLRTFGLVGGSLIWDYTGLDATLRYILAHSAEDVVYYAMIHFIIVPSTGTATSGTLTLTPNTNALLYNVGSDTVTLYVNTNGSVTVARTGGTLTYKLIVQMLWL
ncbi:MAG: hypothetical protein Q8O07_03350 [Chloroflexota bacterium]|nr:hypothetical protein [Chloroflexota bacterium]